MHRRQFILAGLAIAGTAALGVPLWHYSVSTQPENRALVFSAILPALLYGALPADGAAAAAALQRTEQALHDFIPYLPKRQQQELDQLINALAHRVSRLAITGYWVSVKELTINARLQMLQRWRESYLVVLQQAYHGLRELLYGAFYGQPEHWQNLNYTAPRFR